MNTFDPTLLQPGDVLLYRPGKLRDGWAGWFFGLLIAIKTWTRVSHCEVYIGDKKSVASRDGRGVAKYPLRLKGLGFVLRPKKQPVDMLHGLKWFYSSTGPNGHGYDWWGLLVFSGFLHRLKVSMPNRDFCSEFLCRWCRDGTLNPLFNDQWDSDRTPPSMILSSVALELIWQDGDPL